MTRRYAAISRVHIRWRAHRCWNRGQEEEDGENRAAICAEQRSPEISRPFRARTTHFMALPQNPANAPHLSASIV